MSLATPSRLSLSTSTSSARSSSSSCGPSDHVYASTSAVASPEDAAVMTSWDRMRLAKMALIEAEEAEARRRKQRRKSRRESQAVGLGIEKDISRVSIASSDISTLSSSHRNATAPPSILRRRPTESSLNGSISSSSLDSYTPLPPPISRFATTSPDFSPDGKLQSTPPRMVRRRSSKVRFSDDEPPIEMPSPTSTSSLYRGSSVDGLRDDLARSTRLLSLEIGSRTSGGSYSSISSEQFALTSPLTRMVIPETLDDFVPQTLSYPRLARRASRLSMASSSSQGEHSVASTDASFSSAGLPAGPLLAMVNRSSLSHSPRQSVSTQVAPPARASFGSVASTMLTKSGTSSKSGSIAESSSDVSYELPKGSAYSALLQTTETAPNPDRMPTINRKDWQIDLGLSPRSGPSPVPAQEGVMQDPLRFEDVIAPPPLGSGTISPLVMTNPFDSSAIIASIPQRKRRSDEPAPLPRAAIIDSVDMLPVSSSFHKSHSRTDSTLSAVLNFPLPPSRMFEVAGQASETEATDETLNSDVPSSPAEICLDTPRPDFGLTSTFSSAPAVVSPPASPTIGEMMATSRRKSQWSDEDIELDITSPLFDAALSNGILSPNSSRLSVSPEKSPKALRSHSTSSDQLKSGMVLTSGRGWSGSESEEEEFVNAIRSITLRKLSGVTPRIGRSPGRRSSPSRGMTFASNRPPLRPLDRFSQMSSSSSAMSSADSYGPQTPSTLDLTPMSEAVKEVPPRPASAASSTGSTIPGDFAWGRRSAPASPTGSIRSGRSSGHSSPQRSFYEELSSSLNRLNDVNVKASKGVSTAKTGKKFLPTPTRKVEGWGRPEVMMDEQWDLDAMWDGDESEAEVGGLGLRMKASGGSTPRKAVDKAARSASPDLGEMIQRRSEGEEYGNLMEETLEDVGHAF